MCFCKGFIKSSRTALLAICMFSFGFLASVGPVVAQQKIDQAQAIAMAQKKVGGRILRVKETSNSYRVKMLQASGRVITVDVNRSTGKIQQSVSSKKKGK